MKKWLLVLTLFILFLFGCSESPEVQQAKAELYRVDNMISVLDAKIKAVPALELNEKIRQDLGIQIHALGFVNVIDYNKEPGLKMMEEWVAFMAIVKKRDANIKEYSMDDGPEIVYAISNDMVPIINDDLSELEKVADVYDSSIELAKQEIKEVPSLTVERTSKTEKYFNEHAKKKAQYESMVASLEKGSSKEFRTKVAKLKKANIVFGQVMSYFAKIHEPLVISSELRETFPSVVDEAGAIAKCFAPGRDESLCNEENFIVSLKLFAKVIYEEFKNLGE